MDKRVTGEALQEEIMSFARQGRLHEHPDRVEIVQLQGEDCESDRPRHASRSVCHAEERRRAEP